MRQRIISGIFIGLITLVACLFGGYFLMAVCLFIDIYSCIEVLNLRDYKQNSVALFIVLLLSNILLTFGNLFLSFDIQRAVIIIEPIILCLIAIINHNVDFEDVGLVYIFSIFVGLGSYYFIFFESISRYIFMYLVIISYLSDIFAYVIGSNFGKHQLNDRISPKKSVEGFVGGWLITSLVSFGFAYLFNYFYFDPIFIAVCSFLLPLVSETGDLIFSLVKRYYHAKDFSDLIPGHGGLLDRLDSLFITVLVFGAIVIFVV